MFSLGSKVRITCAKHHSFASRYIGSVGTIHHIDAMGRIFVHLTSGPIGVPVFFFPDELELVVDDPISEEELRELSKFHSCTGCDALTVHTAKYDRCGCTRSLCCDCKALRTRDERCKVCRNSYDRYSWSSVSYDYSYDY